MKVENLGAFITFLIFLFLVGIPAFNMNQDYLDALVKGLIAGIVFAIVYIIGFSVGIEKGKVRGYKKAWENINSIRE